ncbi:MAG: hypothetical protein HOK37_04365 [Gammaproteobacteria bacterium]|jgi:hypothetical protein|nr:hypothetical protein [Gammaproteobacteria bacterium]
MHQIYEKQKFEADEVIRKREENLNNTQRFFNYNDRRIKHGLLPLDYAAYLTRKHGPAVIPAIQPQHRDNVVLLTR